MRDLGKVKPGETIFFPFGSYDGGDGSSITMTGLAVGDIDIYKDGGTTERATTTGYTLLDTDGIDFDAKVGIHGFSVDLSSNATAGFFEGGSRYFVVVDAITIDTQTVRFVAGTFVIGYEGSILDTTIATLASQTSFTLEDGSADNDAYNDCPVIVHDVASDIQVAIGYVSDYVGLTKTVTLASDPGVFTMAAADNISIFMPTPFVRTVPWNAAWDAEVESEVNDALVALHLDHLMAVDYDPASPPGAATALLNELVESDGGVSRFTVNALEQAWQAATRVLTANTNLNDPTAATIRDAILDRVLSGNHDTADTPGAFLQNVDVLVSSRSSHGDPDPSGFLDVSIASRLAASAAPTNWSSMGIEADGHVHADIKEILGLAAIVTTWRRMLETAVVFTVGVGSTATNVVTDLTEVTVDHYKDRVVLFATGAMQGQGGDITAYAADGDITITALTEAPASGVIGVIV